MSKTIVGIAVLLLFAVARPVSSQVTLGVRAGASLSDLSVDTEGVAPDLDSRTGFVFGGFADVPLTPSLSFQPGLQYAQKGAEVSGEEEGEEVTVGIHLDYVEIPLLLKYTLPTTGSLGFNLYGGPALALEVGCELAFQSAGFGADVDCDQGAEADFEIETTSFDVGALFGGGIAAPLGPGSLLVEVFYNVGLANVFESAGDDTIKNRAFYVTAGVGFPVG